MVGGTEMKSVTIRDKGKILIKVIHRKNGEIELLRQENLLHLDIEVRDDTNKKVYFREERK